MTLGPVAAEILPNVKRQLFISSQCPHSILALTCGGKEEWCNQKLCLLFFKKKRLKFYKQ
jgi:hypothetical protein